MSRNPLNYADDDCAAGDPRWVVPSLLAAAAYPVIFVGTLYGTWLAGRLRLGHWPRGAMDDPAHIGGAVDPLYTATVLLLLAFFPAMILSGVEVLWVAALARCGDLRLGARGWVLIGLPALTWSVAVCLLVWHGHRLIDWIMD